MSFISFGSFLSIGSSINPSVAWVRGKGGEGRFRIKLPLDPTWYKEQACTRFQSLEHRKERSGFQHEFIVLKLENNSICRIERMGDPDASFDAISNEGIAAHDIAQSFPPDKLPDAHLDTSDVVAQITFPHYLDLWMVLLICRAMQEGEKTCNYTLQVFNCYFFALVIQAALTRLVAGWGNASRDEIWHSAVTRGLSALSDFYEAAPSARDRLPFMLQMHSALRPDTQWPAEDLMRKLEQELHQLTGVSQVCNAALWLSDMGLAVDYVLCRRVRDVAMGILKGQPRPHASQCTCADLSHILPMDSAKAQSEDLLLELVSHAISQHEQVLQASKMNCTQQGIQRKVQLFQEFESLPPKVHQAERTLEFSPGKPQSYSDSPQSRQDPPQLHPDLSQPQVSQLSVWLTHAKKLALWTLQVVLGLFWIDLLGSGQPALCVFIEDELELSLAALKAPKSRNEDETTLILQKLRSLIATSQLVQWKEWPWDHLYKPIKRHILELLPKEENVLQVSFPNSADQTISVSEFQKHLLKRIQDHAERVESFKLGSAANIQDEMQGRISQVWALIRPDNTTPAPRVLTLLEEWLNSPNPAPISLPEFKTEARRIPVFFEARVKRVSCHRLGIHEYILVHCSVMLPAAQRPIMAHFRLERNPTKISIRLLSGKNPAADTIRMSVNIDMLHPKGSWAVRGYFVFNQEDNAPQPPKLKHILEMYEYLSQESRRYIFDTNCRWLCFGLLECLRDCKPCFGGQWFECGGKDSVPRRDTQAAARAKICYLKEKHAECCNSHPRPSSIMAALVAEATEVGIAVSNV